MKLLRKGVYPYDYMDEDWENKLKEKELLDIKYFCSSLNNTKCSVDDCNYAKELHKYFSCEDICNYNDFYVQTHVFLLANVFANYRKNSYESFGLDPLYCVSVQGFSNRAMLKMANSEIKLITNINMHLMIEKGIKEGRCEPTYYHAKANNKYVNPNFDKEKDEESYIISLDAKSLYASTMCYKLPFGKPKLDNDVTKYTVDYILNLDSYSEYLYVFVVDIHYPSKLHDRDFEFPILCDQSDDD